MTNNELMAKCREKKDVLLSEINTTPKKGILWLYLKDGDVEFTTVFGNNVPTGKIFASFGYRGESYTWEEVEAILWGSMYVTRGDSVPELLKR